MKAEGGSPSLRLIPSGESKQKEIRHLNVHQDDKLDEAQFAAWLKQANEPGAPRTDVSGRACVA
jgi:hypothetical protein